MSKRTPDTNVERILAKLGVASRTQIPAALPPYTDRPPHPPALALNPRIGTAPFERTGVK